MSLSLIVGTGFLVSVFAHFCPTKHKHFDYQFNPGMLSLTGEDTE